MANVEHVPTFITSLEPVIRHWGYWSVLGMLFLEDFGVLVPGETVLVAAAFYAGLGQLNIWAVALVGLIGAVMGDNVGFMIGFYGGHPLAERYGRFVGLTPKRIDWAVGFFKRYGGRVVAAARFIDGLRQLNGIVAGISEMAWIRFLVFNVIGAVVWVGVWSAIGYFGGSYINTIIHGQLYLTIAVLIAIVLAIAIRIWHKKHRSHNSLV